MPLYYHVFIPCFNIFALSKISCLLTSAVLPGFFLGRSVAEICLLGVLLAGFFLLLRSRILLSNLFADKPLVWALGGWLSFVCITLFSSHAPWKAFWEIAAWVRYPLLWAVWAHLIAQDKHYNRYKNWIFISMACVWGALCLDGFVQFISGFSLSGIPRGTGDFEGRLASFLGKPWLGTLVASYTFPLAGYAFCHASRLRHTYMIFAGLFVSMILVFISGERSATVLFLAAFMVVMRGCYRHLPALKRFLLACLIISGSALGALVLITPHLQSRLILLCQEVGNFTKSVYGIIWETSWMLAQKSYFLGTGYKTYRTQATALFNEGEIGFAAYHPHNFYLEWLCEGGILVLICFSVMIYHFLRTTYKEPAGLVRSCHLAALFFFFWPFATTLSFFDNMTGVMVMLSLLLLRVTQQRAVTDKHPLHSTAETV